MKSMCCLCIQFTHENTSERTILHQVNNKNSGGGGGQTPADPPPFPGLVACTAKKASYAPVRVTGAHGTELPPFFLTVCLLGYFQSISLLSGKRDEILKK